MYLVILEITLNEKGKKLRGKTDTPIIYYLSEEKAFNMDEASEEIFKQIGIDVVDTFNHLKTIPLPGKPLENIKTGDYVRVLKLGDSTVSIILGTTKIIKTLGDNSVETLNPFIIFDNQGICIHKGTCDCVAYYLQQTEEKDLEEAKRKDSIILARNEVSSFFMRKANVDKLEGDDVLSIYEIIKNIMIILETCKQFIVFIKILLNGAGQELLGRSIHVIYTVRNSPALDISEVVDIVYEKVGPQLVDNFEIIKSIPRTFYVNPQNLIKGDYIIIHKHFYSFDTMRFRGIIEGVQNKHITVCGHQFSLDGVCIEYDPGIISIYHLEAPTDEEMEEYIETARREELLKEISGKLSRRTLGTLEKVNKFLDENG